MDLKDEDFSEDSSRDEGDSHEEMDEGDSDDDFMAPHKLSINIPSPPRRQRDSGSAETLPSRVRNNVSRPWRQVNTLYWDELEHISVFYRKGKEVDIPKLMGNPGNVAKVWKLMPDRLKKLVGRTGFVPFIEGCSVWKHDEAIFVALAERWWDTTHTFHFAWGEMTFTPMDFTAITSLPFEGSPVLSDIDTNQPTIESLIDTLGYIKNRGMQLDALKTYLLGFFLRAEDADAEECRRCVQAFLLFVLGETLFAGSSTLAPLPLFSCLRDLDKVGSFNWAAAGLAELYTSMDIYSRDASKEFGGFCTLWEVWAYEYLRVRKNELYNPVLKVPVMSRWRHNNQMPANLPDAYPSRNDLRAKLNSEVCPGDVQFRPWRSITGQIGCSVAATERRVLLRSPHYDCFYLGERVSRQWDRELDFLGVPLAPPADVFCPNSDQVDSEAEPLIVQSNYEKFLRLWYRRVLETDLLSLSRPKPSMFDSGISPLVGEYKIYRPKYMSDSYIRFAEPRGMIVDSVSEKDPFLVVHPETFNRKCKEVVSLREELTRVKKLLNVKSSTLAASSASPSRKRGCFSP